MNAIPAPPYTEQDLRAEAARQLATLTQDPDFMGIAERMEGADIESTLPADDTDETQGTQWDSLGEHDFETAQRAIEDLISKAADIAGWAVEISADGLEAHDAGLSLKGLGPDGVMVIARVHFAFATSMPDDVRSAFVEGTGLGLAQLL